MRLDVFLRININVHKILSIPRLAKDPRSVGPVRGLRAANRSLLFYVLTQEQWRDFKSKGVRSGGWMSAWRCCEKPNLHTLRRFAPRGARACGRPFCARPSGSSCSGRGGGVQAAGSQASSSWRRRALLGATPVAQCARPRRRLRLMRLPSLTKLHVHPCHYGIVVHPAWRGGSRVLRPGGGL